VTISALYSPPKHKVSNLDFYNYLSNLGNNFIVGGDYNAKHQSWGCHSNNPRGCVFHTYASAKNLNVLAPPDPTYWPSSPRKSSTYSIFLSRKFPSVYTLLLLTSWILTLTTRQSYVHSIPSH